MKRNTWLTSKGCCLLLAVCPFSVSAAINPSKTLWDNRPAQIWEECFPQGDGRLGIMADGGIRREKIVLNEITLWSGSEYDHSNPEAAVYLPVIRELLLEGKNVEAQNVMYEHFVPKTPADGDPYGCYQMLADLNIDYYYPTENTVPVSYTRSLDLDTGTAETVFTLPDGSTFRRVYATPRGQDGILVHLTCSSPGSISFSCCLSREGYGSGLTLGGRLDSGQDGVDGIGFRVMTDVKASGKSAVVSADGDSILHVYGADEAWIAVTAATSYLWPDDYATVARTDLARLLSNPSKAVSDGIKNHSALMARAGVLLPSNANSFLPTAERLERFQTDDSDASLAALYYNYGRYLSISSTRPDLLPPNLQGLWANEITTPWNGDYHTNINVQMNHWPVEQANLSELHLPLVELVKRAVPSGERTAKAFYGDTADGWVMHMMTNIWNYTEPGHHPSWGATNTGGAWLCAHLWNHYLFNGDKDYLREIYPVMKGAAKFFLSTMINEPSHGWLVTAPSSSPENEFFIPGDTVSPVSVCFGPTMDTQIISELWQNVVRASESLGLNDSFTDSLRLAVQMLPPMNIDSEGRLMEWLEEYREVDRQHRHISHLYGLYPGTSISVDSTPQLAAAAARTLDVRGDKGTGWSRAWKINFHNRLHNGDRAWSVMKGLFQPAVVEGESHRRPGTFPNLFCSHPPFQIDGNFGGAAGIGEMFIQSHDGFIDILPALPQALPAGSLYGFKAHGGAEISLVWENSLPLRAVIKGGFDNRVRLRVPSGVRKAFDATTSAEISVPDSRLIDIPLEKGRSVTLMFE